MNQHTVFAQNILSPMGEPANVGVIIRHHLERQDGSGFPDGPTEEKIPYCARILGTANASDEIFSRRRFTMEKLDTEEERVEFAFQHLYRFSGSPLRRFRTRWKA